jgi:hypothetical protein
MSWTEPPSTSHEDRYRELIESVIQLDNRCEICRRGPQFSADSAITLMAGGMCDAGNWVNATIGTGRQLLRLPGLPFHARMLVSPELASSCGKSGPSALFHSPYMICRHMYMFLNLSKPLPANAANGLHGGYLSPLSVFLVCPASGLPRCRV